MIHFSLRDVLVSDVLGLKKSSNGESVDKGLRGIEGREKKSDWWMDWLIINGGWMDGWMDGWVGWLIDWLIVCLNKVDAAFSYL